MEVKNLDTSKMKQMPLQLTKEGNIYNWELLLILNNDKFLFWYKHESQEEFKHGTLFFRITKKEGEQFGKVTKEGH